MKIRLLYLYPEVMNTYGDRGNVMFLEARAQDYGIDLTTDYYTLGDHLDISPYQLLFFGGGQDKGQDLIANDLLSNQDQFGQAFRNNIAGLLICGGYQMFGKSIELANGEKLNGLEILPVRTLVGSKRKIGNLLVRSQEFGQLIGFENHSGNTILEDPKQALGETIMGYGNNDSATSEGIIYSNLIGTYMHGPFLPKNIQVADWLLGRALDRDLQTNTSSALYQASIRARKASLLS